MSELLVNGPGTILVVDDTAAAIKVVVDILRTANFLVLQADSGYNALALASRYEGRIDLLLANIKMEGLSGLHLGVALRKSRPDLHVMFTSSFPGGDLLVLNYGWAFIDQLSVPVKLLEMVNVVLHTPDKSQGSHQYDTRVKSGAE